MGKAVPKDQVGSVGERDKGTGFETEHTLRAF